MKKIYEKSGITLIALIVTIIILLILAGISISAVVGDNGILNKARDSKEKAEKATVKERASFDITNWQIENGRMKISENMLKDILEEANLYTDDKYYKELTDTGIITNTNY